MITDGHKWDPLLLRKISANESILRFEPVEGGLLLPAGRSLLLNQTDDVSNLV
jgi:hypothetical protein